MEVVSLYYPNLTWSTIACANLLALSADVGAGPSGCRICLSLMGVILLTHISRRHVVEYALIVRMLYRGGLYAGDVGLIPHRPTKYGIWA